MEDRTKMAGMRTRPKRIPGTTRTKGPQRRTRAKKQLPPMKVTRTPKDRTTPPTRAEANPKDIATDPTPMDRTSNPVLRFPKAFFA